jgi:hypothetical protein
LLVGASGEIAGSRPFRETAGAVPDALLTVMGYARVKRKETKEHPSQSANAARGEVGTSGAPALKAPEAVAAARPDQTAREKEPPRSPGYRQRNYIRETEEDEIFQSLGSAVNDDPLAAPVGGHARLRCGKRRPEGEAHPRTRRVPETDPEFPSRPSSDADATRETPRDEAAPNAPNAPTPLRAEPLRGGERCEDEIVPEPLNGAANQKPRKRAAEPKKPKKSKKSKKSKPLLKESEIETGTETPATDPRFEPDNLLP